MAFCVKIDVLPILLPDIFKKKNDLPATFFHPRRLSIKQPI